MAYSDNQSPFTFKFDESNVYLPEVYKRHNQDDHIIKIICDGKIDFNKDDGMLALEWGLLSERAKWFVFEQFISVSICSQRYELVEGWMHELAQAEEPSINGVITLNPCWFDFNGTSLARFRDFCSDAIDFDKEKNSR